jgi:predicted RNA polymerase sigma factor
MVALNRAVAVAMVFGPRAGLEILSSLDGDAQLGGHHRIDAVRGHLLERAGDPAGARMAYDRAAQKTVSVPEQRYLRSRAARLSARG